MNRDIFRSATRLCAEMPPISATLGHDPQTTTAFAQNLLGKNLVVLAPNIDPRRKLNGPGEGKESLDDLGNFLGNSWKNRLEGKFLGDFFVGGSLDLGNFPETNSQIFWA